jgi:hypothetical protein
MDIKHGRRAWIPVVAAVATAAVVAGASVALTGRSEVRGQAPLEFAAAPPATSSTPAAPDIPTGIMAGDAELVFSFRDLSDPDLPQTTFGLQAGWRDAAGVVTPSVLTNEFDGPDDGPGFHGRQAATEVNDRVVPEFGYYVGPATRIVRAVGGSTQVGRQAVWDRRPGIVVFWFPDTTPDGPDGTVTAYDAAGAELPGGHDQLGRG